MSEQAAVEIKYALHDARSVCERLGLLADRKSFSRQAGGLLIRCPVHADRTPSCSVQVRSGILLWNCHACGGSGDALTLIAAVHGLSMRGDDFRQVLILGAELAGLHALVQELETGQAAADRPKLLPRPEPEPERDYPPVGEVDALWASTPDMLDADGLAWAESRGLDGKALPTAFNGVSLARSLPADGPLPRWASYGGRSWRETGHRLIAPVYDHLGVLRSVRAIRVIDGESPKRLPPGGHRASGLVLACEFTLAMLRGTFVPSRVLFVEGEPDFLACATTPMRHPYAIVGIISGSWTADFASRVPAAAKVFVYTHRDDAGDRYAKGIEDSLPSHAIFRWKQEAA